MATHSSTLAWKIPWTEEPGGLQFMGSLGVGHGESHGQRGLLGYSPWGHKESDTTRLLTLAYFKVYSCLIIYMNCSGGQYVHRHCVLRH